jgi:membrane associated rhomboid family serine protease
MQTPEEKTETPTTKKPVSWVRLLSYLLIVVALILTVFYDRFGGLGDFPTGIIRVGAIGTLILGAILFFSVREKPNVDRTKAYREVFGKKDK